MFIHYLHSITSTEHIKLTIFPFIYSLPHRFF